MYLIILFLKSEDKLTVNIIMIDVAFFSIKKSFFMKKLASNILMNKMNFMRGILSRKVLGFKIISRIPDDAFANFTLLSITLYLEVII